MGNVIGIVSRKRSRGGRCNLLPSAFTAACRRFPARQRAAVFTICRSVLSAKIFSERRHLRYVRKLLAGKSVMAEWGRVVEEVSAGMSTDNPVQGQEFHKIDI
jgi:hypothetical protein